jgi:hypothetical protein
LNGSLGNAAACNDQQINEQGQQLFLHGGSHSLEHFPEAGYEAFSFPIQAIENI